MKKLFAGIVCLFIANLLPIKAQQIEWGPDIKYNRKKDGTFNFPIRIVDNEMIGTRSSGGLWSYKVLLAKYSMDDLSWISTEPRYDEGFFAKGEEPGYYSRTIRLNGQEIMIYSKYARKEKKHRVYTMSLNEGLKPEAAPEVIYEVTREDATDLSFTLSEDSTRLLLSGDAETKRNEQEKLRFIIYDFQSKEIVQEKEIVLPKKSKDVWLSGNTLTENKIYLLTQENYEKEERKQKNQSEQRYYYNFYAYDLAGDSEADQSIRIELKGKYINSIRYVFTETEIIICGYYGNKNSTDISGTYYIKLDRKTGDEVTSDTFEFSKEFIDEFYNKKQLERAERKGKELEVPQMRLREFIIQKDGSAVMVGEQYYAVQHCSTDSKGNTYCYYVYHYNDIIVTHIDEDGQIEWCTKIPKRSSTRDGSGRFLGYTFVQSGEDLYFLYNDNILNIESPDVENIKSVDTRNAVIVMAKVDKSGDLEKTQMTEFVKKSPYTFDPQASSWMKGTKTALLFQSGGKVERFGKITFP